MMTTTTRTVLAIVAFAVLTIVAIAGWLRSPSQAGAASNAMNPAYDAKLQVGGQPVNPPQTANGQAAYAQNGAAQTVTGQTNCGPAGYVQNGSAQTGSSQNAYAQSGYGQTGYQQNAYGDTAYQQASYNTAYDDGYYPLVRRPIFVHAVQQQPVVVEQVSSERVYTNGPRTEYRQVHRGRSKAHSIEIVAGTAGVGAVIGALAGGGKGAAIGAASGAGAGFAYDRLTHKH